ncbi:MAG: NifB/NifX family molybdenum-iron cluster-binding protein [Firmicutes bacterium]|nr:NifB/NifX family molybdenum-iron cluster-binding protein [Bacillota bacterium]
MKICIPTLGEKGLDERVSEHFGSAPYFTIVDLDSDGVEVINNQNQHHSHGQCHPMGAISGKGVNGVVCGGMGRRAVELLNREGIKVYLGKGNIVKNIIAEYKEGNLPELTAESACGGHGCH